MTTPLSADTVRPDPFERAAGLFVAAAASKLDPSTATLAFASPLCARTPDESDIWHRGLRARSAQEMAASLRRRSLVDRLKALLRLVRARTRYACARYGTPGENLLVLTSLCGSPAGTGFQTPYIASGPDDALLVFGDRGTCGLAEKPLPTVSLRNLISVASELRAAGRAGAAACGLTGIERELLELEWERWVAGYRWVHEWRLSHALESVIAESPGLHRVGCIHEMHAYARVVWRVAQAAGLDRHTVQHAVVASGKRWYFPTPEERLAGLAEPTVMFVFSERDRRLLADSLPDTRIRVGCSGRYAFWRDAQSLEPAEEGYVLFAGALAGFDNDALFAAMRVYLASGSPYGPCRARLHPYAVVGTGDTAWMETRVAAGDVQRSSGVSLADDLCGARAIVGMGTTVLQEALLLGRPVVQLIDDDHVNYVDLDGVDGACIVDVAGFSAGTVGEALASRPSRDQMRDLLGLDKPLVDYGRLFGDGTGFDSQKDAT